MTARRGATTDSVTSDAPPARRGLERNCEITDRAALGLVTAGIAHEMNNVLSYVLINLEGAQGIAGEQAAAMLEDAIAGTRRLAEIVGDLRSSALGSAGDGGPRDAAAAVRMAVRMAFHHTSDVATVRVDAPSAPLLVTSRARVEQVVLNLILNAVEAMPRRAVAENSIDVRVAMDGAGFVVIEVEDNGGGIDADVLPRIFDPFITTKAPSEGTGLGLFVCRELATLAGGSLTVAPSAPGRTRFRAVFPAAKP